MILYYDKRRTNKTRRTEVARKVKKNLAQSSAITKMRLLTIALLCAAQVLALDIESDIRGEFYKQGLLKSPRVLGNVEIISGLNDYCRIQQRANRLAEEFVSPIEQTIFEEAGGDAYDIVQEQAREFLRTAMAFFELSQDEQTRDSVANFFNANAAHLGKLFTENDYKNFTIK
nr:MAG TPA: hypothetical protein [Caudoviricetes sp.]